MYEYHVGIAGYCHLAYFGVLIPLLAVISSRKLSARDYQPRQKQFIAVMVVHFLYDLAAGMLYGYWGERLGYPIEGVPCEKAVANAG